MAHMSLEKMNLYIIKPGCARLVSSFSCLTTWDEGEKPMLEVIATHSLVANKEHPTIRTPLDSAGALGHATTVLRADE